MNKISKLYDVLNIIRQNEENANFIKSIKE